SDYLLMGFDSFALPFSFFAPPFLLPVLLKPLDAVVVFGIVAPVLLALTLVSCYWVLYQLTEDRLASVAGACIYSLTTYSLLKLAQNDETFLSILAAPTMFHLVRTLTRDNFARNVALLTLINAVLLYFAFVQEYS